MGTLSLSSPSARVKRGLDADAIRRLLPHRAPFLLLDRVLELDPPARAVGLKNVTVAEPWFAGHFPEHMVFPGVLLGECLAQLAGVVMMAEAANAAEAAAGTTMPSVGLLAEIKSMRFRKPVYPGDQVNLAVELLHHTSRVFEYRGIAKVAGIVAAQGKLVIAYR